MKQPLTPKQLKVYNAILYLMGNTGNHGIGITVDEIRDKVGDNSASSTHWCLKEMRTKGWVDWTDGKNRSIYIIEDEIEKSEYMEIMTEVKQGYPYCEWPLIDQSIILFIKAIEAKGYQLVRTR